MFEAGFTCYYCFEVCLKFFVHGLYFFINSEARWNIFDFILILLSVFSAVGTLMEQQLPGTLFLRTMRFFKLSRALRVLRALVIFEDLRLMIECMSGAILGFFWCLVMVCILILVFSLFIVQGVHEYLVFQGEHGISSPEEMNEVTGAFGSVSATMYTTYSIISGGTEWCNVHDILLPVGANYARILVLFVSFMLISVWNVVTSIFINGALRCAKPEADRVAIQKYWEDIGDSKNLTAYICENLDRDGSGTISRDEIESVAGEALFIDNLESRGIGMRDIQMFFEMLSHAGMTSEVPIEDFVTGCMHMKGPASAVDLRIMSFEMHSKLEQLNNMFVGISDKLNDLNRPISGLK